MHETITIGHTSVASGERLHQIEMPRFGLGVWQLSEGGQCKGAILHAINSGYRLIDTARAYSNESETGEAIRESGVERDELFVVTKLRRMDAVSYDETIQHCRKSLDNLGLDRMDLYLVHAPPEDIDARADVWRGMEECLARGWTRAIGVSNYGAHHLDAMRSYATIMPSVNQIEIHPWLQRPALHAATEAIGAVPMAYSPLARGDKVSDERLVAIAESVGCTPAQAAIKWVYDTGAITIPKSSNHGRIDENYASLSVDLAGTEADFAVMEEEYVSGWNPTAEP
jgi:diketogulonate reductase-like aldo/keto reductase